jgi:hypothetical protein
MGVIGSYCHKPAGNSGRGRSALAIFSPRRGPHGRFPLVLIRDVLLRRFHKAVYSLRINPPFDFRTDPQITVRISSRGVLIDDAVFKVVI